MESMRGQTGDATLYDVTTNLVDTVNQGRNARYIVCVLRRQVVTKGGCGGRITQRVQSMTQPRTSFVPPNMLMDKEIAEHKDWKLASVRTLAGTKPTHASNMYMRGRTPTHTRWLRES